ncbi:MAG TPA: ArsA family ATPase [Candidatus Caldiarchaeum subterraneum]|uniref:ArsA family ATPase n=1 Tax=Caldiarchaeum subterraneum TaxID=311458 RepID=A0A833EBZ7_CALS0|nr:ArsA family ATPase [Candidatus Caldarchaeum subterraneum]
MAGEAMVNGLKYIFVGGKGGVGKTVIAAALAYELAVYNGKKTLLVSLNPVHSLSSLFEQELSGGKVKQVEGSPNLYSIEVEIDEIVERYKEKMSSRLREFFRWAEVPLDPGPFINIATTNPAFQEAAMFDRVMDIVVDESKKYDAIVFDTAAVANAIRLIGLSKLYGLWLNRMIKSRKEALETRYKLAVRKEKILEEIRNDPIIADLISLHEKFKITRGILTDPSQTGFFFVTLPQALPISVVKRFINMVKSFDIPIGGVFVNSVLTREEAERDGTGYLKTKLEEQERYLNIISREMGEYIRGYVRLAPREITGVEALRDVIEDLHTFRPG